MVGRELFTHAAAHQAAVAVRDAFYPGRGRAGAVVPWATFTEPALAHAGLTAAEARDRFGARRVQVHVGRWRTTIAPTPTGRRAPSCSSSASAGGGPGWWARMCWPSGAGEVINELVVAIERG